LFVWFYFFLIKILKRWGKMSFFKKNKTKGGGGGGGGGELSSIPPATIPIT